MTALSQQVFTLPSTFSLPILEDEIARLVAEINVEKDHNRNCYLVAAFQALMWERCPNGYSPPSEVR